MKLRIFLMVVAIFVTLSGIASEAHGESQLKEYRYYIFFEQGGSEVRPSQMINISQAKSCLAKNHGYKAYFYSYRSQLGWKGMGKKKSGMADGGVSRESVKSVAKAMGLQRVDNVGLQCGKPTAAWYAHYGQTDDTPLVMIVIKEDPDWRQNQMLAAHDDSLRRHRAELRRLASTKKVADENSKKLSKYDLWMAGVNSEQQQQNDRLSDLERSTLTINFTAGYSMVEFGESRDLQLCQAGLRLGKNWYGAVFSAGYSPIGDGWYNFGWSAGLYAETGIFSFECAYMHGEENGRTGTEYLQAMQVNGAKLSVGVSSVKFLEVKVSGYLVETADQLVANRDGYGIEVNVRF